MVEAYGFLASNYDAGDEIFLFGFSRGAFTARSICAMINCVGLLTSRGMEDFYSVFKDWENQDKKNYISAWPDRPFSRRPNARELAYAQELENVGLLPRRSWGSRVADTDTAWPFAFTYFSQSNRCLGHCRYADHANPDNCHVEVDIGALGIPTIGPFPPQHREYAFINTRLPTNVEYAYQALALDEHRKAFIPTLWEQPSGPSSLKVLRQCWFPGVHSNVSSRLFPPTTTHHYPRFTATLPTQTPSHRPKPQNPPIANPVSLHSRSAVPTPTPPSPISLSHG